MDAHRFPADHAECSGTAERESIVVKPGASECRRDATRDYASSTGFRGHHQPGVRAIDSRGVGCHGSGDHHGPGRGPLHFAGTRVDGTSEERGLRLVETYLQNLKPDAQLGAVPKEDHYFLGRLDLERLASTAATTSLEG
jgi:hypothetical protein